MYRYAVHCVIANRYAVERRFRNLRSIYRSRSGNRSVCKRNAVDRAHIRQRPVFQCYAADGRARLLVIRNIRRLFRKRADRLANRRISRSGKSLHILLELRQIDAADQDIGAVPCLDLDAVDIAAYRNIAGNRKSLLRRKSAADRCIAGRSQRRCRQRAGDRGLTSCGVIGNRRRIGLELIDRIFRRCQPRIGRIELAACNGVFGIFADRAVGKTGDLIARPIDHHRAGSQFRYARHLAGARDRHRAFNRRRTAASRYAARIRLHLADPRHQRISAVAGTGNLIIEFRQIDAADHHVGRTRTAGLIDRDAVKGRTVNGGSVKRRARNRGAV